MADTHRPFALLQRALWQRRRSRLDAGLGLLLLALALMIGGFVFWQVRIPLDGAVREGGPLAALRHLACVLIAMLLAAAALAGERMAALLRDPPGPEWRALPIPAAAVLNLLRSEARAAAAVVALPIAAALIAASGLLALPLLILVAAATLVAWLEATRLATALVARLHASRPGADAVLPWAERALVPASRPLRRSVRPSAPWRAPGVRGALWTLDARRALAEAALRPRTWTALVLAAIALVAWASPAPPPLRRAQGFVAFLLTSGALGALALGLAARAPAPFAGALPVGLRNAWAARATALAVLLAGLAVSLAAAAAAAGDPGALGVAAVWVVPGWAVALLGLHHGLTLPGRMSTADGFYFSWLGVSLVASLMIPFLGWFVLAGALMHSLRTLPRGEPPET